MDPSNNNIPYNITNNLEQRIADAFLIYDFSSRKWVENIYISTILHFLGCIPSAIDIEEFTKLCEFSDIKGSIHISRFIQTLSDWLLQKRMKPANSEELLKAFAFLDTNVKGFLLDEEFIQMMSKKGEYLNENELNIMYVSAIDRTLRIVPYENYIIKLLHKPDDCIYKQAEYIQAEKLKSVPKTTKRSLSTFLR